MGVPPYAFGSGIPLGFESKAPDFLPQSPFLLIPQLRQPPSLKKRTYGSGGEISVKRLVNWGCNMMRLRALAIICLLTGSCFAATTDTSSPAVDDVLSMIESPAFKGLDGVVISPEVNDEATKLGLTERMVKTKMDLALRTAGIPILQGSSDAGVHRALLSLDIQFFERGGLVIYSMNIDLFQWTTLLRKSGGVVFASTWSAKGVGIDKDTIRTLDESQLLLDQFCNTFLKYNPKK